MSKWIGIGLLVAGIVLIVPLIIAAFALAIGGGGLADCGPDDTSTVADTGDGSTGPGNIGPIPGKFIPFYQGAAAQFGLGDKGPSMLAGIHFHETSFSTNVATSGPYVGPMAIGSDYWDTYGVDGDGDGKKDIMNEADAIYAAAKILKGFNAKNDWRDALASYNAGPTKKAAGYGYADDVMKHAEKHHVPATGGGGSTTRGADCSPGAGGGTVSGNVQELAQQVLSLIKGGKIGQSYKSDTGDTMAQLKRAANGQEFQMTCRAHGGPKNVDVNPDILKAIIEASNQGAYVDISNITDKCHSSAESPHYRGEALDLTCSTRNIEKIHEVAKKYGGTNNYEVCPGAQHWHIDFPK
ncbi:MAG TPA: lytic murein transglycosylase [Patescibacteria group bacterium]|jgi:hypothetical protein